ncbi:MAG: amidohydrolase family protein [Bacillota bacterium]
MTATAWLAPWPWPNTGSRPWATKSVLALASAQTELVDLRGRSVIPGIIDSHNHAWEAGEFLRGLVTFGMGSIRELQQAVRAWAGTLGPGEWLHGGGFIEGRTPHRWNLDVAAPVVLERIFSTWVANFRALALAGITRDTPDPPGGESAGTPPRENPRASCTGLPSSWYERSCPGLWRWGGGHGGL